MTTSLAPIVVLSFDRPDYLTTIAESIAAQQNCQINNREIYLFQDGAINKFSGNRYAADSDIAACINTFKNILPQATVINSEWNLGVALNYERAEQFVFSELNASWGLFFEDDLALQANYIKTLEHLGEKFLKDDRVGYIAAYGDHRKSLELQEQAKRSLINLGHFWGFLLYRRHWEKMRPQLQQFLSIVQERDYRQRNFDGKIRDLIRSWGYKSIVDSQDWVKKVITLSTGTIGINTLVCYAQYIGRLGLHMRSEQFEEMGYANTSVFPEWVEDFEELTEAHYKKLLNAANLNAKLDNSGIL